jgi:hypothetical protein
VAFLGDMRLRYAVVLANALCVLSYSPRHAQLLRALSYDPVFIVPMYR